MGDGSTTFNIPDMRGRFARGWDHGAGIDPDAASRTDRGDGTTGDNVGTNQLDEFKAHVHPTDLSNGGGRFLQPSGDVASGGDTGSAGGSETRPINVYVMFIIKT